MSSLAYVPSKSLNNWQRVVIMTHQNSAGNCAQPPKLKEILPVNSMACLFVLVFHVFGFSGEVFSASVCSGIQ